VEPFLRRRRDTLSQRSSTYVTAGSTLSRDPFSLRTRTPCGHLEERPGGPPPAGGRVCVGCVPVSCFFCFFLFLCYLCARLRAHVCERVRACSPACVPIGVCAGTRYPSRCYAVCVPCARVCRAHVCAVCAVRARLSARCVRTSVCRVRRVRTSAHVCAPCHCRADVSAWIIRYRCCTRLARAGAFAAADCAALICPRCLIATRRRIVASLPFLRPTCVYIVCGI
jgi:hypothetical protein